MLIFNEYNNMGNKNETVIYLLKFRAAQCLFYSTSVTI